jgi:hypothetical protein
MINDDLDRDEATFFGFWFTMCAGRLVISFGKISP